jgi:hypothetical protein
MTKINFVNGSWKTIEFDQLLTHGEFTIFNLEDESVLTAVTRNMTCFEKAHSPEPNDNRRFTARK